MKRSVPLGMLLLAVTGIALTALLPRAEGRSVTGSGAPSGSASTVGTTLLAVVVSATRAGGAVRPDSIGLSVETSNLGEPGLALADGIAPLLKALGPSLLRVGGDSADQPPATVTPIATLRGLQAVLRASGWSVMITEDLGHYSAAVAQADARRGVAVLGSRLVGIACGNEAGGFVSAGYRARGWGLTQLIAQDKACLQVVHAAAPRVPLVGPDSSRATFMSRWTDALSGLASMATTHFYPMASCPVGWVLAPTLLGPAAQVIEGSQLAKTVSTARAHGMSFRVDETNSAACRGIPGLSDSYASALWGADDVFTVLGLGAQGLNFHGLVTAAGCRYYSPICLPAGGRTVRAQPLYAGLLLAHDVGLGPLLRTSSSSSSLRVHAVARTDGRTGVLLENESGVRVTVQLAVPGAPGLAATTTMSDPRGLTALAGTTLRHGVTEPLHVAGATATYRETLAPWTAQVLVTPTPRATVAGQPSADRAA
ncbi:MAG: hypothetical protein M3Y71_12880 [Actinomycetota bacterium]|nr:hypothetical protein [Actinomycetota bacterium]